MLRSRITPFIMWLLPLTFFAYQFILRVCPGVFREEIIKKFSVSEYDFGSFSSAYYLGYAGCQIPLGILLDKFQPRYVISASIYICAIGTYILGTSNHWQMLLFARFLIGAGSAVAFLGTAKIINIYFPKHYSVMVGFTFTIGLIGAICGGKPLTLIHGHFSWENIIITLAIIAAIIATIILLVLKNEADINKNIDTQILDLTSLWNIIRQPKLLLLGICGGLMVGPLEGFADVWGISYLNQIYDLSKTDSSYAVSFIFLGMCFGAPLLSYLSEKYNSHYLITSICALLMASLFLVLIYFSHLPYQLLLSMFFLIGILCCYQVVIFTIVSNLVPKHNIGIATAIVNTVNMAFGSLFHLTIGSVLDSQWLGHLADGNKIYHKFAFANALAIIPAASIMGFVGLILLKYIRLDAKPNT